MLSFKGSCIICWKSVSVFNPGFVCNKCERRFHGQCLVPPLSTEEMNKIVIHMRHWICEPCKSRKGVDLDELVRTDKEAKDIKKKMDGINDIRNLLSRIGAAVDDTMNQCNKLEEQSKKLEEKNLDLRMRIFNFNDKKMPTLKKPDEKRLEARRLLKLKKKYKKEDTITTKEESPAEVKKVRYKHKLKPSEKLLIYLQDSLSSFSKGLLVQIVLLFLLLLYTLIGAFIFLLIEGMYEQQLLREIFERRLGMAEKIAQNYRNGGGTATMSQIELESYYEFLWSRYKINGRLLEVGDTTAWTFLTAIFFCGITYTTIGFGFFVPVTAIGKFLTMVYLFFGLPLFLILMATLGTWMFSLLEIQWKWMNAFFSCQQCRKRNRGLSIYEIVMKQDDTHGVPILLVITVEIIYLIFGAWIFMHGELWTFLESFYFVFTSMTVGFGDYVPRDVTYLLASFCYIIFGLALTGVVISSVTVQLVTSFHKATHKLGENIEYYISDLFLNESTE